MNLLQNLKAQVEQAQEEEKKEVNDEDEFDIQPNLNRERGVIEETPEDDSTGSGSLFKAFKEANWEVVKAENPGIKKSQLDEKIFKMVSLLKHSVEKEFIKSCLLYTSPSPRDS